MRRRSTRQDQILAARRRMWQMLGPTACARCSAARATDLHEPLCRSRGGDPADPAQCVPLCRACHDEIHANPAQATADGWLIPSWEATMTWPASKMILHTAGELVNGQQRCTRCDKLIALAGTGTLTPWYPGQRVALSESGDVRMSVPDSKTGEYNECAEP